VLDDAAAVVDGGGETGVLDDAAAVGIGRWEQVCAAAPSASMSPSDLLVVSTFRHAWSLSAVDA